MPKGPVETPITDQEMRFCLLLLAGVMTDRQAAEAVGIKAGQAAYVKGKPRVKNYIDQHRASVRAKLVEHESATLVECNIGREQIMAQYWLLARLPAEDTNGTIGGQVRALDSLRDMLGFTSVPGQVFPEDQPEPPDVYQAAWMRTPGGYAASNNEGEAEARATTVAVASQPNNPPVATGRPSGNPARRAVEPELGGNFGRFQAM